MTSLSVLLLDDSADLSLSLSVPLRQHGVRVTAVTSPEQALDLLRNDRFDALVAHLHSCGPCQSFFSALAAGNDSLPTVVVSRHPSVAEAVALTRFGVGEYIEAPVEPEQLLAAIKRLAPPAGDDATAGESSFANIIGASPSIRKVFSLIERVCDADTTVLVRGESGTGKELIAQALHYQGSRRLGPFVPVNCGAIPSELLESELFGHEKGAFTHAIRTRMGRFELADTGTVFLDEISEMSPMLQVKILRVLQERQFERIGGTKTIKSDFRIIAATNRDLEEEVRKGTFREDLYYRLNVIPIESPPLREREGDIVLLAHHFIDKFSCTRRKQISGITADALARLQGYPWPGNVRELENVIERMVILSLGDELTVEDLPERFLAAGMALTSPAAEVGAIPAAGFSLSETVADFEKRLILQALDQTGGVKNRAAKLLNVNRTTLIEKMKRYQIAGPPGEGRE
ncbi:MAG: sigma-54 dependent transcriptional regulator [Desulfobulbaceae bacterium]|nr:sigma-54 dependent transcriptional regulator [Desulfobulbaceae bacterium]